jgi:hypothetical protein
MKKAQNQELRERQGQLNRKAITDSVSHEVAFIESGRAGGIYGKICITPDSVPTADNCSSLMETINHQSHTMKLQPPHCSS